MIRLVATIGLALLSVGGSPIADSVRECMGSTTCRDLARSDLVFVGIPTKVEGEILKTPHTVTFRILEAFKGVSVAPITLDFIWQSAEDVTFVVGERALVMTTRSQNRPDHWWTGCGGSRSRIAEDDEEVAILRRLTRNDAGAGVSVSAMFEPVDGHAVYVKSEPFRLIIQDASNNVVMNRPDFVSNIRQLIWLPPGRYSLGIDSKEYRAAPVDLTVADGQSCLSTTLILRQLLRQ